MRIESDWAVNRSGRDYHLFFNLGFSGIPENGDPLDLVAAAVSLAKLNNSGVFAITVRSHSVEISTSGVISREERVELLKKVVRRAALGGPVTVL